MTCERPRILLVEDDAVIGLLLAEMLIGLGYDVCGTAATEADSVAAAARHRPDLMVVDAQLANGSGVSAIRTILRTTAMRHFFITGAASPSMPANILVLRKPFGENELVRALKLTFEAPQEVMASHQGDSPAGSGPNPAEAMAPARRNIVIRK
ncbi:response regulator [Rhodopila sp.]|uniref:response regulator n=1 Tax=Rhodopila sp. TaxID=2480087 RepID=UPI003D0B7B41